MSRQNKRTHDHGYHVDHGDKGVDLDSMDSVLLEDGPRRERTAALLNLSLAVSSMASEGATVDHILERMMLALPLISAANVLSYWEADQRSDEGPSALVCLASTRYTMRRMMLSLPTSEEGRAVSWPVRALLTTAKVPGTRVEPMAPPSPAFLPSMSHTCLLPPAMRSISTSAASHIRWGCCSRHQVGGDCQENPWPHRQRN